MIQEVLARPPVIRITAASMDKPEHMALSTNAAEPKTDVVSSPTIAWKHMFDRNLNASSIPPEIRNKFNSLVMSWRRDTGMQSSPLKIAMHPAYQQVIAMGDQIVPLILNELKERGGQWYWALTTITGDNPVRAEDNGKINKMKDAWLIYGKSKNLI